MKRSSKSKVVLEGISVMDVDASLEQLNDTPPAGGKKKYPKGTDISDRTPFKPKVHLPQYYTIGRPTKYQPDWMLDKVIELGMSGASRAKIAFSLGITHETLIQWENKFPDFSEALKMSKLGSQVWLEEILQAAILGGVENVQMTGLIFALKSRHPETYREVKVTEIAGKDGDPLELRAIAIDANALDPEQRQLVKQALLMAKAAAERGPVTTIDNEPDDEE